MVRATIDLGCIIKKSPTAGGCWGGRERVIVVYGLWGHPLFTSNIKSPILLFSIRLIFILVQQNPSIDYNNLLCLGVQKFHHKKYQNSIVNDQKSPYLSNTFCTL